MMNIRHNSKEQFKGFLKSKTIDLFTMLSKTGYSELGFDLKDDLLKELINVANQILQCDFPTHSLRNETSKLDIATFAARIIFTATRHKHPEPEGSSPVFPDVDLQEQIINEIASLYFSMGEYSVKFTVPGFSFLPKESIKISRNISIGKTDTPTGRSQGFGLASLLEQATRDSHRLYIEIRVKGLPGKSNSSPLIVRAVSTFKHLVMLGILTGLLQHNSNVKLDINTSNLPRYTVSGPHTLDEEIHVQLLSDAIMSISLSSSGLNILNQLDSGINSNEFKETKIINDCLSSQEIHYERIKASLWWLFDSLFTENTTSSYVLLCLAIEAMVGDHELKQNTKEIISSRMAFSLKNSYNDRVRFIEKFKKFYEKRSKIVHGTESILSHQDHITYSEMRYSLQTMIRNELYNLV